MEIESLIEKETLPYPFGSPRDIVTALFRQKVKILIIFIVAVVAVGWWVYSKEDLYESRATIVLKFGREHIFRPEVGDVDQIVQFNQNAAVESERKILKSRDLVRRVVKAIGVKNLYPKLMGKSDKVQDWQIEVATTIFVGSLDSSAEGPNVIEIKFLHQRPQVAAKALDALIEALQERHLQIFSDPKSGFLIQRLDDYHKDLKKIEHTLQAFKDKNNLSSPIEDQQRRLLDQRSHLDVNHKSINNQLQGLVGKISSIEAQMKTVPKEVPLSTTEGGGMLAKAKADLFGLQRQKQTLLSRYTETSGPVQNIQKEIELIEQFIQSQTSEERDKSVTSGKNPVYQGLEVARLQALSEMKTLKASNEVIVEQIRDLDEKINRLDSLGEELIGLERKWGTAEENYKLYVKKVEEAKVSEEMDQLKMSNISVIQSPVMPTEPAGRSKNLQFFIGTMISLFFSLGLGFVFEYLQGGYTRPDQAAEDLGLPILSSFSYKR